MAKMTGTVKWFNNKKGYGLYHFASSGIPPSRYEFVNQIFKFSKKYKINSPKLLRIKHSDLLGSKIRPQNSCLNNKKINRVFKLKKYFWKKGLKNTIDNYFK